MRQTLSSIGKILGLAALVLGAQAAHAQSLSITGQASLQTPFVLTVDVSGLSTEQAQALQSGTQDPDTLANEIKISFPQLSATPLSYSAATATPDLPLYAQFLALNHVGAADAQGNVTLEYTFQIGEAMPNYLADHLTGSKQLQVMVGFLPPKGELISGEAALAFSDTLTPFNHAQHPIHGVQCVAQNLRGKQFVATGRILANVQNHAMNKCKRHSAQCHLVGCSAF